MELKNHGWALQWDGSYASAETVAKRMYPGVSTSSYEHVFTLAMTGSARFRAPGRSNILIAARHDWVIFYEGLYAVLPFVPDDWRAEPRETRLMKNIMFDWMNYR